MYGIAVSMVKLIVKVEIPYVRRIASVSFTEKPPRGQCAKNYEKIRVISGYQGGFLASPVNDVRSRAAVSTALL